MEKQAIKDEAGAGQSFSGSITTRDSLSRVNKPSYSSSSSIIPSDHISTAMLEMSVERLKSLCLERGLPVYGTKAVLVARIREFMGISKSYRGRA